MKNRQWIYLGFLGILLSCSNRGPNKDEEALMEIPVEAAMEMSMEEAHSLVIREKIKEQLERYKLQQSHPEFEDSNQIEVSFLKNISNKTELENIEVLTRQTRGDTTRIIFMLRLKEGTQINIDTLQANLVTEEVVLEGEALKTTSISFQQ